MPTIILTHLIIAIIFLLLGIRFGQRSTIKKIEQDCKHLGGFHTDNLSIKCAAPKPKIKDKI